MKEDKFCVNCKFREYELGTNFCTKYQTVNINKVTGEENKTDWFRCTTFRQELSWFDKFFYNVEKCGPEGKFFERKS